MNSSHQRNMIQLIILVLLVVNGSLSSAACLVELKCLNFGSFNKETCACDCFPAFTGKYCEKAECDKEPPQCENMGKLACQDEALRFYCPKMCGLPACKCGYSSCLNGGIFDQATCSCSCLLPFTGKVCEDCQRDNEQCGTTWQSDMCSKDEVFQRLCPRLCKYKNCDIISPVVQKECPPTFQCFNHGKLNKATCQCECLPNYVGEQCETLLCPIDHKDPALCDTISSSHCSVDLIFNYCPHKCGQCSLRPSTTTAKSDILCEAKKCRYAFEFDDVSECKCVCDKVGFSGELCEIFDCKNPVKDDEFYCDSEVDCNDDYDISICPKMCLCKA